MENVRVALFSHSILNYGIFLSVYIYTLLPEVGAKSYFGELNPEDRKVFYLDNPLQAKRSSG
jgi:hypothetical protein